MMKMEKVKKQKHSIAALNKHSWNAYDLFFPAYCELMALKCLIQTKSNPANPLINFMHRQLPKETW